MNELIGRGPDEKEEKTGGQGEDQQPQSRIVGDVIILETDIGPIMIG